jgi:hypothetical protein
MDCVFAQQSPPIRITLGAKGWLANWNLLSDEKFLTGEYAQGSQGESVPIYGTFKPLSWGFMAGPYGTISMGSFSATISYAAALATFNTEYREVADDGTPVTIYGQPIVVPVNVKREDINIVATYRFVPEFGLFVNGKFLLFSYSASFMDTKIDDSQKPFTIGGGIVSSYSFPQTNGLTVFGYLGALYNTDKDFDNEVTFLLDAGLAYRYVALGFRLEAGKDTGSKTTLGPTLSLFYTF